MLHIELVPSRPVFQPRRDLAVRVTLRNGGAAPLDLPNPAALRAAPAWRLTPWSGEGPGRVFGNLQGFAPPKGQPERLTLAPGADWSGTVAFFTGDLNPAPGDWALSLLLPVDGETIESEPCRISIAEWSAASGAAGYGETAAPAREGDTLVIQAGPGPLTLCRMPWLEDDSDRSGVDATPAIPLTEVSDDACDPIVPTRDAAFWSDPARWWLWREGATIHAMNAAGKRQRLELPEAPARLLPTALQPAGGDITLAALSQDRTRADIVVLSRDGTTEPVIAGTIVLPEPAEAATLTFASGDTPLATMYLTVHVTRDGGARLLRFTLDGVLLNEAAFPSAAAIPNGTLATHAAADGAHFAATLVRGDSGPLLIQARFPADPAEAPDLVTIPVALPEEEDADAFAPVGFGIVHGGEPEETEAEDEEDAPEEDDVETEEDDPPAPPAAPPGLHGVVELSDGRVLRLNEAHALEEATFQGVPARPFVLVPTSEGALLLCVSGVIGPFMSEL